MNSYFVFLRKISFNLFMFNLCKTEDLKKIKLLTTTKKQKQKNDKKNHHDWTYFLLWDFSLRSNVLLE